MTKDIAPSPNARGAWALEVLASTALIAYAILLASMARRVEAGLMPEAAARTWLTAGSVVAGTVFIASLFRPRSTRVRFTPARMLAVGLTARLIVCAGPPLIENDYFRYFWDGAVVAAGVNPYRHAPQDVARGIVIGDDDPALRALATSSGDTLARINHPHLTTIYPPLAQGAFALAWWIDPFGATGWRFVLLLAEALTILLLAKVLGALGLPMDRIAWIAWNPLVLREVYSSLHMDMLALPLIAGAVLAAVRGRWTVGALLCVAASAVKVWPILLLPVMLRPMLGDRWRIAIACIASAALATALWLPVFAVTHSESSGFVAYGRGWQNNDGFFRAGIWLTERVLTDIGTEPWHSHTIMRWVSAALVLSVVVSQCARPIRAPGDIVGKLLIIVGAVFLLSPTQFPWYWTWCLPLLAIRPFLPLLLYMPLLPFYYVSERYSGVLWIEHAPVWASLALMALWRFRARLAQPAPHAGVARA